METTPPEGSHQTPPPLASRKNIGGKNGAAVGQGKAGQDRAVGQIRATGIRPAVSGRRVIALDYGEGRPIDALHGDRAVQVHAIGGLAVNRASAGAVNSVADQDQIAATEASMRPECSSRR